MRTCLLTLSAVVFLLTSAVIRADPPATVAASQPAAAISIKSELADLDSPDPKTRIDAVNRLRAMGPAAVPAAERLCQLLSDGAHVRYANAPMNHVPYHDVSVSMAARQALESIGAAAAPALKNVLHKAGTADARSIAADLLVRLKTPMDDLWTAAIFIKDNPPHVRAIAAAQLAKSEGKDVEAALIHALGDPDSTVRVAAVRAFAFEQEKVTSTQFGYRFIIARSSACVEPLITALKNETLAATAEAPLAAIGADAVPALLACVDNPDFKTNPHVFATLAHIAAPKALDVLLPAASHKDPAVRAAIAASLAHYDDPRAADAAIALSADSVPAVREAAYNALACMPKSDADSIFRALAPARIAALKDPEPSVRSAAAGVLASYVEREKNHAVLLEALQDKSDAVRAAATYLLREIGPEGSIDPLIHMLHDPVIAVRRNAIHALTTRPWLTASRKAVPDLIAMLHDPDWFTAELAVDALSDLGDPQAIDPLIDTLENAATGPYKDDPKAVQEIKASCQLALIALTKTEVQADAWRQWRKNHAPAAPAVP